MATIVLNSVGSIATFINECISVPVGVSGNMIEIVELSKQHVANFTGHTIDSNSIDEKYRGAIVDFAKADTIDLVQAQPGGEKLRLAELSIDDSGDVLSAKQYRIFGDMRLKAIGRKIQFARSLS